jgi:NAD(P)-dependent dehydrogenase (short-subunit alcohol dehydrogenase family)
MPVTVDFAGRAVIVTGGTRGLGKAIGLEFARCGATVFLTHRWGSADEDALRAEFVRAGLAPPEIIESDASDPDAARDLMRRVGERAPLAAIVSNVAFAKTVDSMDDLKRSSLELSLRYSAWPIVDLLQAAKVTLGTCPRYALAISTDGGAMCHPGYDLVGAAKAVLETLCRYLALRLKAEGVRVNAVRCGPLDTASLRATFGDALPHSLTAAAGNGRDLLLDPQVVGRACVALCSGLMDGVTGQVLTVDEGWSLVSPVTYLTGQGWPGPFPSSGSDDA